MSDELERELTESLKRVPAPEGFTDRVMERVAAKERRKVRVMPVRLSHAWQTAIAAMLLVTVLCGGAGLWQRRRERQRAEFVERQFEVAMRVTGRKLDDVGERISRAGMKEESERR